MPVKRRKLVGKVPRPKFRAGVLPTRVEKDRSKIKPRKKKHKKPPSPDTEE